MNKWLTLVVLVLLVLASAVGLRNLTTANQKVASVKAPAPVMVASTGNPVPILPDTFASTGNPVPVLPDTR